MDWFYCRTRVVGSGNGAVKKRLVGLSKVFTNLILLKARDAEEREHFAVPRVQRNAHSRPLPARGHIFLQAGIEIFLELIIDGGSQRSAYLRRTRIIYVFGLKRGSAQIYFFAV